MMSNLVEFAFDGASVRVVMCDGEPWFVAADVAAVLGYSDTHSMVRYLDADEKGAVKLAAPSGAGEQTYVTVSESGLYEAVFRSTLPEAQAFRKWVTSEVLPSIRKTGGYGNAVANLLADEKASRSFLAYKAVADACGLHPHAAIIAADNVVSRKFGISFKDDLRLELNVPTGKVPMLVSDIGHKLGYSGSTTQRGAQVNAMLVALGFQEKLPKGGWKPTKKGEPYAFVSATGKKRKDGTPVLQVKWSEEVIPMLEDMLK